VLNPMTPATAALAAYADSHALAPLLQVAFARALAESVTDDDYVPVYGYAGMLSEDDGEEGEEGEAEAEGEEQQ
jgi:hypothetical protein